MTFTIDDENNITAFATRKEVAEGESFSSYEDLASLAANWATTRLVEVWNSIPGVTSVNKFRDRKTGTARIWKAIQSLECENQANVAMSASTREKAKPANRKPATVKSKRHQPGMIARARSKKSEVLGLLRRKNGATLKQIMEVTGWQPHSVRGFISGAAPLEPGTSAVSGHPRNNSARQHNPSADLRVMRVLHQTEVVEVPLYSTTYISRLANIESFELRTPSPSKNVNARPGTNLSQIQTVNHVLPAGVPQLDRPAPLNLQLHPMSSPCSLTTRKKSAPRNRTSSVRTG